MIDEVWLYTDGAARGNPGPAAAGFRILNASGQLLFEHEESLGDRTNNQAEYAALILGLAASSAYTLGRVTVGSDSKLMVRQMKGEWRVKDPELRRLHEDARTKGTRFREVRYDHHPRSHPEVASVDRALNRLLDLEVAGSSTRAAVMQERA
jgi:ribonuclease HI